MSADEKDDIVNKIKVEVGESEDEDDLVPLFDPLSPSSDLTPTPRRYDTRKRQAKTVVYEGSDSDSDKGSDWELDEVELRVKTPPKNIKRIKVIKIEDGLSSASSQKRKGHTGSGGHTKEVKRRQRRQKQSSANSSQARKCGQGSMEHSKTDKGNDDDGVTTEPLGWAVSQPGKDDVQRKSRRQRSSRPITDEEREARAERRRAYRRKYREKLKAARFNMGAREEEVEHGCVQRTESYLDRYEARLAKRREQKQRALARMTPEQRAERRRKAVMHETLRKAAMTEEQRQEQRHKYHMKKVMLESKLSAEELEAMKERRRARTREYKLKMTEEQRQEYLEKGRQYIRQYWRRLSPEERRRRILKMKEGASRTPEQREQKRQQARFWNSKYRLRQKLGADGVPPEQIAEKVRDFVANYGTNPPKRRIRTCRRYEESDKLDPAVMARLEPKERQLLEWRFYRAKNNLRRKLTAEGVPLEQIEEKIKELKANYEKSGLVDRPPKLRPNETPEQREARLLKARVAVAKFNLRKRLSANGAPPEEIEETVKELVAKYESQAQAEITFRPHKARAKQKRWIRNESDGAASGPSSPNSDCEPDQPDDCTPPPAPPVPDACPPQMDRAAIDISPQLPHLRNQMPPELNNAHSKESFKSSLGNNARGGSSIVPPTLGLISIGSKYTAPQWATLPPPPPEPTPSIPPPEADFSDGDWAEQDENNDSDQEEFVQSIPRPPPKIPRRSPSGGTAKRRPGRKSDGPRGSYKSNGPLVICDLCGNGYSARSIVRHKKIFHNPNWVNGKCVICGMEFSVGVKFLTHYYSAHLYAGIPKATAIKMEQFGPNRRMKTAEEKEAWKSRRVGCKLCGITLSGSEIAKHKRVEHHPDYKDGNCSVCKMKFGRAVDFYEHFQREHFQKEHRQGKRTWERKKEWVCSKCGDGFASSQSLRKHDYLRHGEGSKEENFPVCPLCGNKYRTTDVLEQHLRKVHPEEFPSRQEWQCRRCVEKCRTNKELLEHVTAQHPDSYFPCPHVHCKRFMYTEQNLSDHILICKVGAEKEGSWPFWKTLSCFLLPCEFCSTPMRMSSMKDHYRLVHGVVEQPWKCSVCSQPFSKRHNWLNHLDRMHGIPFDDELKEEARKLKVPDRSQVEVKNPNAIKTRTRSRIYNNKKRTARKSRSPKESMNSSSEDDQDKECKKTGEEIDKRREHHRKWQTFARVPLACEICSKTMRLSSIKDHYRMVHGVTEQPWPCNFCPKTFLHRESWLHHLDWKHGIPMDDELKEQARKMNVADRSQVEVQNLKGINRRNARNGNCKKKMARKSRSPKEATDSSSEDDEAKDEQRQKAGDGITKRRSEDTQKNKASEVEVKLEIPEVEKEKRLMISVVRLDEKEISKWINKSDRIVCKVEVE